MKNSTLRVFHLDDEKTFITAVRKSLTENTLSPKKSFIVESFQDVDSLLNYEGKKKPDVILLDYILNPNNLDSLTGFDAAVECQKIWPTAVLILLTNMEEKYVFEKALSLNSPIHDFLPKNEAMTSLASLVINIHRVVSSKLGLKPTLQDPVKTLPAIAGRTLNDYVRDFAPLVSSGSSIMIEGATGVGKSLLVSALLCYLPKRVPIIQVDAETDPASKIKQELIAITKQFESGQACGWIVIENIHKLSPALQRMLAKLLWTSKDSIIEKHLYLKLIATTNESMEMLRESGELIKSLLKGIDLQIIIPALNKRHDEIEELINHFLTKSATGSPVTILKPVVECLKEYPWEKGNVRELFSTLSFMFNIRLDNMITPLSLPSHIRIPKKQTGLDRHEGNSKDKYIQVKFDLSFRKSFDSYFYEFVAQFLNITLDLNKHIGLKPSIRHLAKQMQMSRITLTRYIKKLEELNLLSPEQFDA